MSIRRSIKKYIKAVTVKKKNKLKTKPLGYKYAEQSSGRMGKFSPGEENLYFNGGSAAIYDEKQNPSGLFYYGRLAKPMTADEMAKMQGKTINDPTPDGIGSWDEFVMKQKAVSSMNIGFIEPFSNLLTNTNINKIPTDQRYFFVPPEGGILEDVRCKVYRDSNGKRRINLVGPLLRGLTPKGDAIVSIAMYDGDWEQGPTERNFIFKEVCDGYIPHTGETISVKNPQNPFQLRDHYYMFVRSMRPEEMRQIWITQSEEDRIDSRYVLLKKLPGLDPEKFPKGFQRIAISSNQIEGISLQTIFPQEKSIPVDLQDKNIYLQLIHYVTKNTEGREKYKVGLLVTSIHKNEDVDTLQAEGVALNILDRKDYPKPIRGLPSFLPDKEEIVLPVATCTPIMSPFSKKDAYLISGGLEDCVLGSFILNKSDIIKLARSILQNRGSITSYTEL